MNAPLTQNEAAYIAAFLEELDDRFGNDGCNDMSLPNTPENREMVVAADKIWCDENDVDEDERESKKDLLRTMYGRGKKAKLSINNQTIILFLKKRLMEAYGLTELPTTQEI